MALRNRNFLPANGSKKSRVKSQMIQKGDGRETRQFGLISGAALVIGSCVGTGIFFKSGEVLERSGTGWLTLIAWLIGGLTSISIALCFAEISTIRMANNKGLASWAGAFLGRSTGRLVSWMHLTFYFAVDIIAYAYYVVNEFFKMVIPGYDDTNLLAWQSWILILGIMLLIGYFVYMTMRSSLHSKVVQVGGTFVKYIPIILTIGAGIFIIPFLRGGNFFDGFTYQPSFDNKKVDPSISGLMFSLAPVLFSYDSFLNVGNVTENIKNPRRNMVLAIVGGMIVVTITYILFSWALFSTDANPPAGKTVPEPGNSLDVLALIFNSESWGTVVKVFILISGLVVLNAEVTFGIRLAQSLIDSRELVGHQLLNKPRIKKQKLMGGAIALLIITGLWYFVLLAAGGFNLSTKTATQSGSLINSFSDVSSIIFFVIYALIIIGVLENRFSKRVKTDKKPWLFYSGVISVGMVFFIVGYYFYLVFSGAQLTADSAGETPKNIFAVLCAFSFLWCAFGFINLYFCPGKGFEKVRLQNK